MFDIGFPELLLVSVVALLIFGPERLPEVLRTVGRWLGTARRSFTTLKDELEREVGADEIRREMHNSRIMEEARKLERQVASSRDEVEEMLGKRYDTRQDSGRIDAAQDASSPAEAPSGQPTAVEGPEQAPPGWTGSAADEAERTTSDQPAEQPPRTATSRPGDAPPEDEDGRHS